MGIKDLLTSAFGGFLKQGAEIADQFIVSPDERQKFLEADKARSVELQRIVEETVQARYRAVSEIISAEMQHGDTYTKRARPTIVYAGLALYALQTLASPWLDVMIPPEFTYTWGGVCGVWMIGRTTEKCQANGVVGKAASVITGSRRIPVEL